MSEASVNVCRFHRHFWGSNSGYVQRVRYRSSHSRVYLWKSAWYPRMRFCWIPNVLHHESNWGSGPQWIPPWSLSIPPPRYEAALPRASAIWKGLSTSPFGYIGSGQDSDSFTHVYLAASWPGSVGRVLGHHPDSGPEPITDNFSLSLSNNHELRTRSVQC